MGEADVSLLPEGLAGLSFRNDVVQHAFQGRGPLKRKPTVRQSGSDGADEEVSVVLKGLQDEARAEHILLAGLFTST